MPSHHSASSSSRRASAPSGPAGMNGNGNNGNGNGNGNGGAGSDSSTSLAVRLMQVAGEFELDRKRERQRWEEEVVKLQEANHVLDRKCWSMGKQMESLKRKLAAANVEIANNSSNNSSESDQLTKEVVTLRFELAQQTALLQQLIAGNTTVQAVQDFLSGNKLLQSIRSVPLGSVLMLRCTGGELMMPGLPLKEELIRAAELGAEDLFQQIIQPDISRSSSWLPTTLGHALRGAAANGHMAILKRLLAMGADTSSRSLHDGLAETAIHTAARFGQEEAIRLLLATGSVDINDTDVNGATPLHLAASTNQAPVVKYLLLNGANPSVKDSTQRTALAVAIATGSSDAQATLEDKNVLFWNSSVRANRQYNDKNFAGAIECYSTALELASQCSMSTSSRDLATLHYNRARAAYRLGQHCRAVEDCTAALDKDPSYRNAIAQRAECYMSLFDFARAVRDFQALLDSDPADRQWARRLLDARAMRDMTHYQVLGLTRTADADKLKKAYRQHCLKWHPDKHHSCDEDQARATTAFRRINEASEVLGDSYKRMMYDMEIRNNPSSGVQSDGFDRWHQKEREREAERVAECDRVRKAEHDRVSKGDAHRAAAEEVAAILQQEEQDIRQRRESQAARRARKKEAEQLHRQQREEQLAAAERANQAVKRAASGLAQAEAAEAAAASGSGSGPAAGDEQKEQQGAAEMEWHDAPLTPSKQRDRSLSQTQSHAQAAGAGVGAGHESVPPADLEPALGQGEDEDDPPLDMSPLAREYAARNKPMSSSKRNQERERLSSPLAPPPPPSSSSSSGELNTSTDNSSRVSEQGSSPPSAYFSSRPAASSPAPPAGSSSSAAFQEAEEAKRAATILKARNLARRAEEMKRRELEKASWQAERDRQYERAEARVAELERQRAMEFEAERERLQARQQELKRQVEMELEMERDGVLDDSSDLGDADINVDDLVFSGSDIDSPTHQQQRRAAAGAPAGGGGGDSSFDTSGSAAAFAANNGLHVPASSPSARHGGDPYMMGVRVHGGEGDDDEEGDDLYQRHADADILDDDDMSDDEGEIFLDEDGQYRPAATSTTAAAQRYHQQLPRRQPPRRPLHSATEIDPEDFEDLPPPSPHRRSRMSRSDEVMREVERMYQEERRRMATSSAPSGGEPAPAGSSSAAGVRLPHRPAGGGGGGDWTSTRGEAPSMSVPGGE